jgi:hypothetical protein
MSFVLFWQEDDGRGDVVVDLSPLSEAPGFAVEEETAYTFSCNVRALDHGCNAYVTADWFDSVGAPISTTTGDSMPVPVLAAGTYVPVSLVGAVSPTGSAYCALHVHFLCYEQDRFVISNAVFAAGASTLWSTGGAATNVTFVVERSVDDGVTWEGLWSANRTMPMPGNASHGTKMIKVDRSVPLAKGDVMYRVYAIGNPESGPVVSEPTIITLPAIRCDSWWLRDPDNPSNDLRFRAQSVQISSTQKSSTLAPDGDTFPSVIFDGTPQVDVLTIKALTLFRSERLKMEALLKAKKTLFLQENGTGRTWYVKVTNNRTSEQQRAQATGSDPGPVRDMHTWSLEFTSQVQPSVILEPA